MRDFPMFSTENGVGSLVLKQIPYNRTAYVIIRSSSFPTKFLQECIEFCRVAGAQKIYASGHNCLETYPFYTSVLQMSAPIDSFPDTDACLFPVTESTMKHWKEIYNEKMKDVDNAAYMSDRAADELLKRGGAYFVHNDGQLLGIGIAHDDRIDCVASVEKGCGETVMLALAHALMCERVVLEVASTNTRAICLYEKMGFLKVAEKSRWYKIF